MVDKNRGDSGGSDLSLDTAIVQSLLLLAEGNPTLFLEAAEPPDSVVGWLRSAKLPEVNGLLVQTLRRWHECRRGLA